QQPVMLRGALTLLPQHPQLLAFEREFKGQRVLCAFNLSEQPATLRLPANISTVHVLTDAGLSGAQVQGMGHAESIEFSAWGALYAQVS
ncbi:MAG: hypothetical protein RJA98_3988, partial [Pseudomonadota bacterium]